MLLLLRQFSMLLLLAIAAASIPARAATSRDDDKLVAQPETGFAILHLAEPLVATGPTTPAEDRALARAVAEFEKRRDLDDFSGLTGFLAAHPHSAWRVAVLTDLGISYLHYGYFSQAIAAWEAAWREGKSAAHERARVLVDRAVGELVGLHAALGHSDRLAALITEIGDRPVSGPGAQAVLAARETLWITRNDPKHLFLCGPMAVKTLLLRRHASREQTRFLDRYRAAANGTSLAEVARLAGQAGLSYRPVFRKPGEPVPVPSIVHWKAGHFTALIGEAGGRFHIEDSAFGPDGLWVTQGALDREASGYFLAPSAEARAVAWREVPVKEAGAVWGAGSTNGISRGDANDPRANKSSQNCGMCGANIKEAAVSLVLSDTPVGYTPPKAYA